MTVEMPQIRARYELARIAGVHVEEANHGHWDRPQLRALIASWRDVATLYDEVLRLREALAVQDRGNQEMSQDNRDLREQLATSAIYEGRSADVRLLAEYCNAHARGDVYLAATRVLHRLREGIAG